MAAPSSHTQYAFNAGELSPYMIARADVDRYGYGARTMHNFIPMLQGPARKRPGTRFVADVREPAVLLSIPFSQTDSWVLAFCDERLRFYTDHGPVLEGAVTITGITQAVGGVVTIVAHPFTDGEEVYLSGVGGMTELNGRIFVVNVISANTFYLIDPWGGVVDTSGYGAYTSGGSAQRLYTILTPWAYADLVDDNGCSLMSVAQSEDVTYICVPGFQPRKLTRSSSTSWSISEFEPQNGPFQDVSPDQAVAIYATAATGTTTLTAPIPWFIAGRLGALFLLEKKLTEITVSWEAGKAFNSGDVVRSQGHYYEALNSATSGGVVPSHTEGSRFDGQAGVNWQYLDSGYGWGEITAVAGDALTATVEVDGRFNRASVGGGNASSQHAWGAWSAHDGWPTHVCFFRERLCFARGTKLWFSVPSDYENFAERDAGIIADDSAFSIDIRQGFNDTIHWLVPSTDLLIGADGNEFAVGEITTNDPFGPSNAASKRGPGYGARRAKPALVNDGVFYALPSGRVVRELLFSFESDGYSALNRTAFAEHITRGQVNQLDYAKEPESIIWSFCANGQWLGLSFEREHQLMAWHRHTLGGSFEGGSPHVISQCVAPSPDGTRSEWYGCVKRTINNVTKYYLEFLTEHWDEQTDVLADMFYVDSGLSDEANASTTVRGLDHLEGESVSVLGDGRPLGEFTVIDGAITLSDAPNVVHAGLAYTAELESMNIAQPGFINRAVRAFVSFVSTVFAKAGGATTTDRETRKAWGPRAIPWTFHGIDVSAPIPAQTRIVEAPAEGQAGREHYFKITHDQPTACTVAGWTVEAK